MTLFKRNSPVSDEADFDVIAAEIRKHVEAIRDLVKRYNLSVTLHSYLVFRAGGRRLMDIIRLGEDVELGVTIRKEWKAEV